MYLFLLLLVPIVCPFLYCPNCKSSFLSCLLLVIVGLSNFKAYGEPSCFGVQDNVGCSGVQHIVALGVCDLLDFFRERSGERVCGTISMTLIQISPAVIKEQKPGLSCFPTDGEIFVTPFLPSVSSSAVQLPWMLRFLPWMLRPGWEGKGRTKASIEYAESWK